MKPFMHKDFLLSTSTAVELFHRYAAPLPIIDYHCHIDAAEIYQNKTYQNLAQAWLGGRPLQVARHAYLRGRGAADNRQRNRP